MKKSTISVRCRGLNIPLYNRIINLGLFSYKRISLLVDKLDSKEREWNKIKILINDPDYITFLKKITCVRDEKIISYLNNFYEDKKFKSSFSKKLEILDKTNTPWGDIRFHSLTLYVAVRSLRPKVIIETGVASGKSSAMILLALEHNNKGQLISIDLPNKPGESLPDGAKTHTGDYDVGWLIPDYLKKRWQLHLGDAKKLLPKILKAISGVDIFLHDSLHTYKHVQFELKKIFPKMRKKGLILCDNIDLGAGRAFNDFLDKKNLVGYAYRDFGGARIK